MTEHATVTVPDADKATAREIREWAKTNGYAVAERGRLNQTIKNEFTAATGKPA